MSILIKGGTIVNEGSSFRGALIVNGDHIEDITENPNPEGDFDEVIDATDCYVLPGIIDCHVHFREPGLTRKADIEHESRAAAYGGVTSYFDMPNTKPQTTTLDALEEKFRIAAEKSHVNYSFFYGATNDNSDSFRSLDPHRIPGVKLFMGSSTGNMLVDKDEALRQVFTICKELNLPIMAHCEDTNRINANAQYYTKRQGEDPEIAFHPYIRDEKVCYKSTQKAVQLALETGAQLHVAHISTAKELKLFTPHDPQITAEAVIAHLFFSSEDYRRKGTLIKCNPAIKELRNCFELRKALKDGRITTVGTDHAPHELSAKKGGCIKAASGMPMIQFSLVSMLEFVSGNWITIERMVELMAHNPARLFHVNDRGFLRQGYKADIAIVRPNTPWTVTKKCIQSKCGWSPMEGYTYHWRVEQTICNGHIIYNNGIFDNESHGEAISFR